MIIRFELYIYLMESNCYVSLREIPSKVYMKNATRRTSKRNIFRNVKLCACQL